MITYEAAPPVPPFATDNWLRPVICASGIKALAGGVAHFTDIDLLMRHDGRYVVVRMDCDDLIAKADDRNRAVTELDRLMVPRPHFAGLDMSRTHLMGVVNVTPDSFSDGAQRLAPAEAIAAGTAMQNAGAAIIDIGGESTRPGATPVTRNQELARVLPPITALARAGITISIDTRHADVMRRSVAAGAAIINDVSALRGDGALAAAAASGVPVILMHMQGNPETMQDKPAYEFAPIEIYRFLEKRIVAARAAGIPSAMIAVDPGFGFGKTVQHNLQLVNWLGLLHGLGVPILFGASRKSTIAALSANEPADCRLPGSLALALAAHRQGAQLIRVHDVAETAQALAIEAALLAADSPVVRRA